MEAKQTIQALLEILIELKNITNHAVQKNHGSSISPQD